MKYIKNTIGVYRMLKGKVPNQRVITINKATCDMKHKYTVNNLDSLDEAAGRLV